MTKNIDKIPSPKKIPKKLSMHDDVRTDNYYWLRDDNRKNKKVINYLKEENKYSDTWLRKNKVTGNEIFLSYKKRLPKLEESYPIEIDEYRYFSTITEASEHRKYYRILKNKKKLLP